MGVRPLLQGRTGPLAQEDFCTLVDKLSRNRPDGVSDRSIIDYEFCHRLEEVLAEFFVEHHPSMSPVEVLQAAIAQYEKLIHPRAFALLEALARQFVQCVAGLIQAVFLLHTYVP